MQRVDIALLFEGAARELDVACALQSILAKRHGLTAEIIHHDHPTSRRFREIRPALVVLPYCYHERNSSRFLLEWFGATFFNLTWEQLFYPGNATAKTPRGEFAVRHVIHNAWSDAYADLLRTQGVPERHIFIGGNPAYALYGDPYRRYFKSRDALASENGLDAARRWLFFPENYNWAFYGPEMIEQMVQNGQSIEQVTAMRDFVTRSFEAAMRWCGAVARRGDVEVIVRPRPGTSVDVFRDRVRDVLSEVPARFSVIQRDTVRDWILASDVVVSSYSTSLIEAGVAERPFAMVEPESLPDSLRAEWHAMAPRVRSEDELVAFATGRDGADAGERLRRWARTTLMPNGDPILRIADQLALIRRGAVPIPEPVPWRSITPPNRYHLPARVAFEYRRRIYPRMPWSVDRGSAARSVTPALRREMDAWTEVPARVRRWQPILDDYLATRAGVG